jgi:hypothetical protein
MTPFLDWLTKYEAVAVWLEGIALVAIFIWDRVDANHDHTETLAQLGIAQAQIKISQNAERAWVLTELEWSKSDSLRVVIGTSKRKDEPEVEETSVVINLLCRNEGRTPAWIEKIQGYCELVEGRLKDLPSPVGHEGQRFLPFGPIAPGKTESRPLNLACPGHVKRDQLLSIFILVEYRDIFDQKRVTTCGYTVSRDDLSRQVQLPDRNRNN